jgi:hypothetical protein
MYCSCAAAAVSPDNRHCFHLLLLLLLAAQLLLLAAALYSLACGVGPLYVSLGASYCHSVAAAAAAAVAVADSAELQFAAALYAAAAVQHLAPYPAD